MGNHYVPKAYLRGFCVAGSDSMIEVFDKEEKNHYCTNITNVAQENRFYSDETEALLATKVEDPAKPAIDKLRQLQPLNDDERNRMAVYAAVLLKRVPHSRQKLRGLFPETVSEVVGDLRSQLQMFLSQGVGGPGVIEAHLEKIEGLEDRMIKSPPDKIRQQMESPWPTQAMVDAIKTMKWRIVSSDGPQYFVTTDNPGFFFSAYGLANPESEFVLPLSSTVALVGDRSPRAASFASRGAIHQRLVKELNRRLVSDATRFIYSAERQSWIPIVATKKRNYLSRIKWEPL